MKKLFALFVLVMGSWMLDAARATAQSIDSAEYFFDVDPGAGNGNALSVPTGDTINDTVTVNTTGLSPGFHYLFIRVKDTNNTWSLYESRIVHVYDTTLATSASIDSAEYFFNTDPGADSAIVAVISPGDSILDTVLIPTAGLSLGFHHVYARVKDTANAWSHYEGMNFYLYDTVPAASILSPPIEAAEYFYDTDPGTGNGIAFSGFSPADTIQATDTLATAPLTAGTHYVFLRVRDTMNVWSLYDWQSFTICNFVPVPDFTSDTVCLNSVTSLTDLTSGLDTTANYTYDWDFDNNGTSDDTTRGNTTHTFAASGTHTVALWVNNTNGCVDTVWKTVYVDSLPLPSFVLPIDTFCQGDSLPLTGGNPPGGYYSGNGVYGNIFYTDSVVTGNHILWYTYVNADSCSAMASDTIYLSPCLGINDALMPRLQVSVNPNPFREETTLEIRNAGSAATNLKLEIYDLFGKAVRQSEIRSAKTEVQKGNLSCGIYFFKISGYGTLLGTGKLIITD